MKRTPVSPDSRRIREQYSAGGNLLARPAVLNIPAAVNRLALAGNDGSGYLATGK